MIYIKWGFLLCEGWVAGYPGFAGAGKKTRLHMVLIVLQRVHIFSFLFVVAYSSRKRHVICAPYLIFRRCSPHSKVLVIE